MTQVPKMAPRNQKDKFPVLENMGPAIATCQLAARHMALGDVLVALTDVCFRG
jgi:hypothetical protein